MAKAILVAVTCILVCASFLVHSSFGEAFCPSSLSGWSHTQLPKRQVIQGIDRGGTRFGTPSAQHNNSYNSRNVEFSPTAVSVFSRLGNSDRASSTIDRTKSNDDSAAVVRGYCAKCKRPNVVCICHALPETRIDCGTRILILQHPREAKKRKRTSTVPLIGLSVQNVQICVGTKFTHGSHPLLDEALEMANDSHDDDNKNNKNNHALLLYPSERAIPLQDFLATANNNNNNNNNTEESAKETHTANNNGGNILVVVDGTWAQTQTMVQNSWETLNQLFGVMFDDATNSLFDALRQEPAEHCTSTLEAVSRAIRLMGHDNNNNNNNNSKMASDALERSLSAMVDGQLQFANDEEMAKPRYYRKNNNSTTDEETTISKRQEKRTRKLVSKKLKSNLSLPKAKTPEEIEMDRIKFVYIAHMG